MHQKPNALIYFRRSGLVVAGKKLKPSRYNFETDSFSNMELTDDKAFVRECTDFLSKQDLKHRRLLIVIDNSLAFQKTIVAKKDEVANFVEQFVDAMPFNPGQRAAVHQYAKNELRIFATNADIYETMRLAMHEAGTGKLVSIVPGAAYKLTEESTTFASAVESFLKDSSVYKSFNFLQAAVS